MRFIPYINYEYMEKYYQKDTILFYVQGLKKGVQNETLSL